MTNTMAVVMAVSRRVGHVTFWTSERTSCRNLNGLTFAMSFAASVARRPGAHANKPADPHPESETGQRTHVGNLSRRKSKRAAGERQVPTAGRASRQASGAIHADLQALENAPC